MIRHKKLWVMEIKMVPTVVWECYILPEDPEIPTIAELRAAKTDEDYYGRENKKLTRHALSKFFHRTSARARFLKIERNRLEKAEQRKMA